MGGIINAVIFIWFLQSSNLCINRENEKIKNKHLI